MHTSVLAAHVVTYNVFCHKRRLQHLNELASVICQYVTLPIALPMRFLYVTSVLSRVYEYFICTKAASIMARGNQAVSGRKHKTIRRFLSDLPTYCRKEKTAWAVLQLKVTAVVRDSRVIPLLYVYICIYIYACLGFFVAPNYFSVK